MKISSISVKNFKRITKATLELSEINVLIGGNNSGKSSFLQAVHLAITSLRSLETVSPKNNLKTLGFEQVIYKPAENLMALSRGKEMTQKRTKESWSSDITFAYTENGGDESKEFFLALRRGKNANLSLGFEKKDLFYKTASSDQPLSILVPGLAGITLHEEKRTDAIIEIGIAQGDSNLYLRNVLLRLIEDKTKRDKFHHTIQKVFPGLEIRAVFDEKKNQHIKILVKVKEEEDEVALELVGTGALQAIQLVAYASMYSPGLLLLDEPDAHLHPSNQRLLAKTLRGIVEDRKTKIILATHSRHILDALLRSENSQISLMKDGKAVKCEAKDILSILLELGALDNYELLHSGKIPVLILTEDTKTELLEILLEANGFPEKQYAIMSYNGADNIHKAVFLGEYFLGMGSNTRVLIHRDSDCLIEEEREKYLGKLGLMPSEELRDRCKFFLTDLTDIEHYFCRSGHISEALDIPFKHAESIVDEVLRSNLSPLASTFSDKRTGNRNKMKGVPLSRELVKEKVSFEQAPGKFLLGLLKENRILKENGINSHKLRKATKALEVPILLDFAQSAFGSKTKSNT